MSPQRNPDSTFSLDDNPTGATPSGPTVAPPLSKFKKTAISIPLTPEGKLDIDRVRDPQQVERVRAALGVVDPATIPPPEKVKIKEEFILPAYSLLEVIIRLFGRKALKWPDALADKMRFAPEKKQALVAPTAEVLAKYAPTWLIANQDIAALGAVLTDAVDDMIQRGVNEYVAEVQAKQNPSPTPASAPVPAVPAPQRFSTPVATNGGAAAAA
jgi:hypothetical protein